jgi:hypothetical protein
MNEKNPVGRPSELLETLGKAKVYLLESGWMAAGDVIPSVAGLACYAKKGRTAIYEYSRQSIEFKYILDRILALQENILLNGSLKGDLNAQIAKLVLGKHGYSDKVEQDHTSTDGTMTPAPAINIDKAEMKRILKEIDDEC